MLGFSEVCTFNISSYSKKSLKKLSVFQSLSYKQSTTDRKFCWSLIACDKIYANVDETPLDTLT